LAFEDGLGPVRRLLLRGPQLGGLGRRRALGGGPAPRRGAALGAARRRRHARAPHQVVGVGRESGVPERGAGAAGDEPHGGRGRGRGAPRATAHPAQRRARGHGARGELGARAVEDGVRPCHIAAATAHCAVQPCVRVLHGLEERAAARLAAGGRTAHQPMPAHAIQLATSVDMAVGETIGNALHVTVAIPIG